MEGRDDKVAGIVALGDSKRSRENVTRWKKTLVWILIGTAVVLAAMPFIKILRSPRGDFPRHIEFGRRLLDGEIIYHHGLDVPYPPFWALAHAPMARLPIEVSQPLVYPIGLASLALLVVLLSRWSRVEGRINDLTLFFVWAATLFASVRFLIRDFDECGPNIFLLTLSWLGIWLWTKHRDKLAGVPLGLAIALKCTAGLFLLYFAWKRQWRFALCTIVATAAFTLSPIAVLGPSSYYRHMHIWTTTLVNGATTESPLMGVLGEDPMINKSLKSGLARYLMHVPEGHLGRSEHPAYIDILELSPRSASLVILGVTLLLVAGAAWISRARVEHREDATILWECAVASILMLLLSPITWGQHCVATIPALFLILRRAASGTRLAAWSWAALALYFSLVFIVNRWMFSRELGFAIESYRPTTWALLLLLAVTVRERHRVDFRGIRDVVGERRLAA